MSSKKTQQVSRVGTVGEEIKQKKQLRDTTLEKTEKLKASCLSRDLMNELRIRTAQGDPEAKSKLKEANAKEAQIEEAEELIGAIDDRLPQLEKALEKALDDQKREERRELAEKDVKVAKEIAQLLDKAARKSMEFLDVDAQICALTRQLGETPGATPKQKLFAEICRIFFPLLGSNLIKRAAYKGSLVEWASRFRGNTGAS